MNPTTQFLDRYAIDIKRHTKIQLFTIYFVVGILILFMVWLLLNNLDLKRIFQGIL